MHHTSSDSGRPATGLTRRGLVRAAALGSVLTAASVAFPVAGAAAATSPVSSPGARVRRLNVLAFNIWHGGEQIEGGATAIAEIIRQSASDVVFLPERGGATEAVGEILGYTAHGASNTGVLSRYPVRGLSTVGERWSKAIVDVDGVEVVAYGGHLQYQWYATYLPRGYGGGGSGDWPDEGWSTWDKLASGPVTDVAQVLDYNAASGRVESAEELLADVAAERAAGRLVVIGGDFNEPSIEDWTPEAADLFDHNGLAVPWQTTERLISGGLVDAYRHAHPDPVTNPGFTWPSDNPAFATDELSWAPEADERDRIDYVFYAPDERLVPTGAVVVGPASTIVRNERVVDDSADEILTPDAAWPSDHKAVLGAFEVRIDVGLSPWNDAARYGAGDRVTSAGSIWEAAWVTAGQKPGDPHGPWQEIAGTELGEAIWTASRIFTAGDEVVHGEARYIADWWTRDQSPEGASGVWRRLAD